MSTVSESQPWWAIVSAEKLFGIASQPLTAAPPEVQSRLSLFSRMVLSLVRVMAVAATASPVERGPLGVEGPAGNQVLHRRRVVAGAEAVLEVEPVRLLDLGHVELDAEARTLRNLDESAPDLQRLGRQPLAVLPDPMRVDRRHPPGRRGAD